MPKLLSGGAPLKGTYGTQTIIITLPTAQLSLGKTPSNTTGYTLVTGANGQLGFTSTIGGVYFNNSTIQSQTANGDLTIQSTGTGRLNLNGNVYINGNNAIVAFATFTNLTVLEHALFASTTTNVTFNDGINVAKDVNIQGSLNAFGDVFLEPYNGVITMRPTGIGTVDILPETLGAMDNVAIGTRNPSSATFTTISATSIILNGAPLGNGAAYISDVPPPNPYVGELWWDSSVGILRVYYLDPNSVQWVDAFPIVAGPKGDTGAQGPAGTPGQLANITTDTLYIDNITVSTSTSTGALRVLGGVGIGGDIHAGVIYSNGLPVLTAATTSWYGVSQLFAGDGLYANTTTGVVTLVNTDTLASVSGRNGSTPNTITITNETSATSTTTGALQVHGGVGVGGSIYVRDSLNIVGLDGTHGSLSYNNVGDTFESKANIIPKGSYGLGAIFTPWTNIYATEIFENRNRVVTSMQPIAGPGMSIQYASTTGPVIVFTITNIGVTALTAGTDTAISSNADHAYVVWNTSTLETVTGRGAITPHAITITDASNNALTVAGTIRAGDVFSGNSEVWTTATLTDVSQLKNNTGFLTSSTLGVYGVTYLTAAAGIGLSSNTGTITITNTGVLSLTTGSGIAISTSTGDIVVSSIDTLASVTARGNVTSAIISITTSSAATSSTNGALRVVGGVGIGGALYAGNIYDNGNRVLNKIQINVSPGLSGGGTVTGPNATVNLVNTGVINLTAGTDTQVSSTTGNIVVWSNSSLQSVTARGNQTNVALRLSSLTSSTSTGTGALVVFGGLGVGENIYASAIYDNNARVITTATLGNYGVTDLRGGAGVAVSSPSGSVILSSTATLELVTSFGSSSTRAISITNVTASTGTASGALRVVGGVGVGGSIYAGNIYDNNIRTITGINPQSSAYIGISVPSYSGPIATFTVTNLGVQSLANGTDTVVSASTGSGIQINVNSTLQSVTARSASTDQVIRITNTSSAITPADGALVVNGGVGIGADLKIGGNVSIGQTLQVTGDTTFNSNVTFNGNATYVLSTNTYYTDNLLELHVAPGGAGTPWTLDDGKDIGLRIHYFDTADKNAALVMAHDTRSLEWYNDATESFGLITGTYGTFKTGSIKLADTTSATSTITGALQIVGGAGIRGSLYVGGGMFVAGSQVITQQSLGSFGVTQLVSGLYIGVTPATGTGTVTISNLGVQTVSGSQYIAVSTSTGTVSIVNLGVQSVVNGTETTVSSSTGSNISVSVTSTLDNVAQRGSTTTHAINITNATASTDTNSGALTVTGGVGIGGALNVAGVIRAAGSQVVTGDTIGLFGVAKVNAGPAISIDPSSGTGTITIGSLGVQSLTAGTDTVVSSTTGTVLIWNTSTLQSVTSRGAITNNILQLTNPTPAIDTVSGALKVTGGVGIQGSVYAGNKMYAVGAEVVTTATLRLFGVQDITAGTGIYVTPAPGTGSVVVSNIGVVTLTAGTDTVVSSATGTVVVWNNSTLQTITNRGSATTNAINITNATSATSTITGALTVAGGVGVGGDIYVGGTMYVSGAQVVTAQSLGSFGVSKINAGPAIAVSPSAGTGTVTITNIGVQALTAGTDTAISSTTGTVTVWNTGTLQSTTNRGAVTNNQVSLTNATASTDTNTGALIVNGGVGVGGALHVGSTSYVAGAEIITTATLAALGVQSIRAGTDTAISSTTGTITIWNTGTLQSITSRGNTTNQTISITNGTVAVNTTTAALTVSGGIGAQNAYFSSLYVTQNTTFGGNVTFNGSATYVSSTNTVYTDNIIDLHVPPGGIGTPWTYTDLKDIGFQFHYYANSTDTNAALVLAQDTGYLEWYNSGTQGLSTFVGTYGTIKAGSLRLVDTTSATSTTTGALQVIGGAGIGGSLYVGGDVTVTGTINATINGTVTNLSGGSVNATTGAFSGAVIITNSTQATSTTTGALQVVGGTGIGGNLYVGGHIVGGVNNAAGGNYSAVLGGKGATTRGITGANAWGYNFATQGDAQQVDYFLSVATTTASPAVLTTDQAAAGATNQIIMPNNSAYGFKGMLTARDTTNGWVAVWEIRGGIRRIANAASTTLVGTPVVDRIAYDSAASTWAPTVTVDAANGGLQIQVTGAAGTNIHWVANMTTIEVA